ncbi:MAG: polysulfide reductase NrfD [Chloroflexi bacterium]|nr:polysulfide reductase NrfD [Chloroflexota bacterium]
MGYAITLKRRPSVQFETQSQWRILILIAFFAGGWGSGLWIVSWYYDFLPGLIAGIFLVAVVKSAAHIAYLGRPERFFRAFANPKTSWLSRGLYGVTVFDITSILYVLPYVFQGSLWPSHSPLGSTLGVVSVAAAVFVMIYTGYMMAYSPAIPFWNTPLLPIAFLFYSFEAGVSAAVPTFQLYSQPAAVVEQLELVKMVMLAVVILTVATYVYGATRASIPSKEAARALLTGRYAPHFYIGIVALGLVIPIVLSGLSYLAGQLPSAVLIVSALLGISGGVIFRWVLLWAAVYHSVELEI